MSAGTIRLTNNSTTVAGTSTTFLSDLKSGDVISTTIGGVPYTLFVDTVTSNTAATLTDAFTGPTTTGAAYVAVPQMTLNRITAALAAQTAEAVRRVLQENANWQAFYSGAGDITVTLPDGTPTGRQVTGPSWAKISQIGGSAWQDRGVVSNTQNLNQMNPATTEGEWHKGSATGISVENNYPSGAAQGVLKIIAGGFYSGTQIYIDRFSNQWIRTLTAAWNGNDGPWSVWQNTATMALRSTLINGVDLNTLNTIDSLGPYRTTGALTTTALNYPYDQFAGTIEVVQGYGTGVQQFAVSNYGNTFMRYMTSATAWSLWLNTGMAALPGFFTGNADTLLDDGDYPTSSATTGLPDPSLYGGTIPPNNSRLSVRSIRSNTSITQEWTYYGTAAAHIGRKFHREKYSTGAWTAWVENIDEKSLSRLYGIGGTTTSVLSALDWQQFEFVTGATYLISTSNMTNIPAGISTYPASTGLFIKAVGANGSGRFSLEVTPDVTVDTNYRCYNILTNGVKGSRTFFARQVWNSANTIVDSNGFIKKASPVIQIFSNGEARSNDEATGTVVTREDVGRYRISGVLGLNADPAWSGIDGGFEIPHDRNKQPLLWVDFDVEASGDVVVKTYHRTHPLSPAFARNYVEGLADGDPCDIPAGRWLDVRVEMPEPEPTFEPEPEPEPIIEPEPDYYDEENQPDTQQ